MEQRHDEHGNALEGERDTPTADEVLKDQGGLDEAVDEANKENSDDPEADSGTAKQGD
jgi:hypothetical protein